RYSSDEVEREARIAGKEILLASLVSFIGIALIAPLALVVVIRRFERDLRALESAASHLEDKAAAAPGPGPGPPFHRPIANLRTSLAEANGALDDGRAKLDAAT